MTQLTSYEFAVQALVDVGFARDVAEKNVRTQLPHLTPPTPAGQTKDENVLEKAEQVEIRKIAIAYGFKVRNLSQARATKQAFGLPDLWLTHNRQPISLWFEVKRQVGGKFSPAQIEFRDDCIRTNTGYGAGDRYAFVEKLIELELAVRGDGQYGITPMRDALSLGVP